MIVGLIDQFSSLFNHGFGDLVYFFRVLISHHPSKINIIKTSSQEDKYSLPKADLFFSRARAKGPFEYLNRNFEIHIILLIVWQQDMLVKKEA